MMHYSFYLRFFLMHYYSIVFLLLFKFYKTKKYYRHQHRGIVREIKLYLNPCEKDRVKIEEKKKQNDIEKEISNNLFLSILLKNSVFQFFFKLIFYLIFWVGFL